MPNGAQYQTVQTGYAGPWVDQVLQALGAPTTDSNRAALRAWAASEGTLTSNNPLAFSGRYPGATTCIAQCGSSSPIMAYSSATQGAANTASFILGNSSYASIVQAFRSDAGLQSIFSAINGSPWCSGCQSGTYPTALHAAAGGATGGTAAPPGAPAGSGPASGNYDPNAPAFSLPVLGTILNQGQELKIKGWFLLISGGLVATVGVAIVLAAFGLESKAGKLVKAIPGGTALRSLATGTGEKSDTAGRRESKEIEERYEETQRQQGPIGPRGGSETNRRVAERQRRGTSVPGAPPRARRQPSAAERRRRAEEPF